MDKIRLLFDNNHESTSSKYDIEFKKLFNNPNQRLTKIMVLFDIVPDDRPTWVKLGLENSSQMRCPFCEGIAEAEFEYIDLGCYQQTGPYLCYECESYQMYPDEVFNILNGVYKLDFDEEEKKFFWVKGAPLKEIANEL